MLKKLGLPYADQSFEIGGASIKVRIEPGHEYISITGGWCSILMDSGVIDAVNLGTTNPARYLPGVLNDTAYSFAYNSLFTTINSKGYRTNPSKQNDGQLSGLLSAGRSFVGAIPPIAYSFYPHLETSGPAEEDEMLLLKKVCGVFCPASVFTGKCRLYVQSMYGQPLYDRNGLGDNYLGPLSVEPGIPALLVSGYAKPGESAVGNVWLNTSCGVRLDSDGKHWLFRISLEGITTYPLIASPCGEGLRKYLKASDGTLNSESKEHLEVYILSTCRPDVANAQSFNLSTFLERAGLYSMGFGWHWNWDGDRADLVKNTTVPQGGVNAKMRSWHYTITVQQYADNGTSGFTFTGDNPGGEQDWAVTRALVVLAEPLSLSQTLVKTNPRYSELFVHPPAPFYAFYRRNELCLCTVETTYTTSRTEYTSSHNGSDLAGWLVKGYSIGERSEWWEKRVYNDYYTFKIITPGIDPCDVHRAKAYTTTRIEHRDKQRTGVAVSAEGGIGLNTFTTPDGVTVTGHMSAGMHYPLSWKSSQASGDGAIVGHAAIVTPMHDAEAIIRSTGSSDTANYSVTEESQSGYMPWDYGYRVWSSSDPLKVGPYEDYIWWTSIGYSADLTGGFPISYYDDTKVSSTGDESVLYSTGTATVAFGSAIHDLMDTLQEETGDPFRTLTSSSGGAVHILAHLDPPIGLSSTVQHPIFVGWA